MGQALDHKAILGDQFFQAIQDDDAAIQAIDARLKQGDAGPCQRETDPGEVSHMISNGRFAVTLGKDGDFSLAQDMLDSCLLKLEAREGRLSEDLRPSPYFRKIEQKLARFLQKEPA